ncbi:MBOAT family O-acyltransferase [Francisella sp. W12-1067]
MLFFLSVKLVVDNGYINLTVIGFSYFMCRQIHCLIDVYSGQISKFSFSDYIMYQLFLPTIYTGPINRYQNFERQFKRLKFDSKKLSMSIERIVYGCFKFIFVANYIVSLKLLPLISTDTTSILNLYGLSIVFWSYLYFAFSGLSDIAIGFSGCFGITIQENFNYPYKAKNIMDFWQRWHMTLTSWVKDYVFMPVFSKFRSRTVAIILALIVIGLWHQISTYYLVWGVYQALGIVIFQAYVSRFSNINKKIPFYIRNALSRLYVFAWILSTIPVLFTMGLTHAVL